MLHSILALAAGGQQVLLRTHRAWMPSDAKARPYDAAVSKFQIDSVAFIFFAMPSVLVPSSLLLEFLKVCATYRSCHPSTWSDGCWSLLAAFSDRSVWVYLAAVGSSRFSANYVRNPRIGSCVFRTVDQRTDFPRTMTSIFLWAFWRCWTVDTGLPDDAWWSRKNVERPLHQKEPGYDGIDTLSFRTLHVGVIYLVRGMPQFIS